MIPTLPPSVRLSRPAGRALGLACLAAGLLTSLAPAAPTAVDSTPEWTPTGWSGGGYYFSAAFHPTRDGVLFLGMDVAGVAKSTDHGKTFRMVNKGLVDYAMYSLAVDMKNPDIVYAGTEGGLHKSTDGGESWNFVPGTEKKALHITSERNKSVRSVASDPTDSNIVYAASPGGKVYKSTDGAATWRAVWQKSEAPDDYAGLRVQFGKVNGAYFGGVWTQLKFPAGATQPQGIGLSLKGDGSNADKVFLNIQTSAGAKYRSRNIQDIFANTDPGDVVFRAEDFIIDPDFAKKSPDKAAAAPKVPDWSDIVRMDLSRVHAPDQASELKIARVFFVARDAEGKVGNITVRDFVADPKLMGYGNVRSGNKTTAGAPVISVVVSTKNPRLVLACTSEDGLLLSDDKGETWRALPTPAKVMHAAFDPTNADIIYAACASNGIMKSIDLGVTWAKSHAGIAPKFSAREIVVNPANPKELGVIGSEGWNGLFYYSADAGASWTMSNKIKPDYAADPTLPDGGNAVGLSVPTNLVINPLNPKELFISANWRPAFSADGGRTWEERVRGADITVQTDVRFSGDRVYVSAMDEGSLYSEDQGKTWKALWPRKYDRELCGHNWRIAVNKVNGVDRIIATSSPWDGKNAQQIIISEDGGRTFKVSTAGLPTYRITSNTMWERGYPRALAVDPSNPMVVYLGIDGDPTEGKQGGGVFKSVDGGYTWKQLPNQPGSRRMYYGLAIDPTNTNRIVWGATGAGGGVHISEDGGDSWKHVFKQDGWVSNVHVAPDGTIYAGANNLWKSADHGATWKQLTKVKGRSFVGIETDPRDARTLWVSAVTWDGSSNGDVLKSTDGGVTWSDFSGTLQHRKPQVLRFNPKTNELWSGQTMLHKIAQ